MTFFCTLSVSNPFYRPFARLPKTGIKQFNYFSFLSLLFLFRTKALTIAPTPSEVKQIPKVMFLAITKNIIAAAKKQIADNTVIPFLFITFSPSHISVVPSYEVFKDSIFPYFQTSFIAASRAQYPILFIFHLKTLNWEDLSMQIYPLVNSG